MGWDGQLSRVYRLVVREKLKLTTAASVLVPGATSFAVRNNADNANNLLISDAGAATVRAGVTVTTGGVILGGATGANGIAIPDNLADAMSVKEGSSAYLTFVTTDSSEAINAKQRLTTTDGVASGTAKVVGGLLSSMTAAGSALTNSNTETVLGSVTIPANTIKLGTVVQIRYQGIVTADNGATTLTVRLRVGATTLTGTAIISHAATDTSANHIFTGFCELVGRAAPGATAACVAKTHYNDPGAAGAAVKAGFMGSTNFATNGALLVEVTGQWSAADANSCRLDILDVLVW